MDFLASIEADSGRIAAALAANRDGVIPWSDDWTVKACAQHVAGAHYVVGRVVEGRPTVDFGVRSEIEFPDEDSPGFDEWVAAGSASLLHQLRSTDPAEPCWSWWPEASTVGFWHRRMAHETLVHRWDIEQGAGIAGDPMDPVLAADGIDEYLDVFVGIARFLHRAPGAGESAHIHCTDTEGEWLLTFTGPSERTLVREHAKGDVAMRGPAEGLLLHLWGRLDADATGVEILGDTALVARWRDLVPAM
jgi:uncharacterized protein (TIGR03083 family)